MKAHARFSYPADLARFIRGRLRELHFRAPALASIEELLEVAYFASMRTEEAERILCDIAYINMNNPDPVPPGRVVANRWSYVRFEQPMPLDVKNLVKVSKSIDSECAALAVCKAADGTLVIWGAIDQQGGRAAYVAREADVGAESPGLLRVSISGVGIIEVYRDYAMVGALRQGRITSGFNDVLGQSGPIRAILQIEVDSLVSRVEAEVGSDVFRARDHWAGSISGYWNQSLVRILLGIQRYGHGGAILLTADNRNTGLRIKYPLLYDRLAWAIQRFAVHTIKLCDIEDSLFEDFIDKNEEAMPVLSHLDQAVFSNEKEETREELTGCVRFIASLSRVDGLVVMSRSLAVRGYGAIIKVKEVPPSVWLAGDPAASVDGMQRTVPSHFGTRHQSMMSMCYFRPGSVGFVVSQDGDVRAMTRVDERLIVWEDVKLRLA